MFKVGSINEVTGLLTLEKKWLCLSEICRDIKQSIRKVREDITQIEKLPTKTTCIFESEFFFLENIRNRCEDLLQVENPKNSSTDGVKDYETVTFHRIEIYSGLGSIKPSEPRNKRQLRTDSTSVDPRKVMFAGLKRVTVEIISHFARDGQASPFFSLTSTEDSISRLISTADASLSLFHDSKAEETLPEPTSPASSIDPSGFSLSRPPHWFISKIQNPARHKQSIEKRTPKYDVILLDGVEIADRVELLLGNPTCVESAENAFARRRGATKGDGLLLKLHECASYGTCVVFIGRIVQCGSQGHGLPQQEVRKPHGEWNFAPQRILWVFDEEIRPLFDGQWSIEERRPYVGVMKQ